MKIQIINEQNKLPLTFNYIEQFNKRRTVDLQKEILYMLKCDKYQTDFYLRRKPLKPLVRML